MTREEQIKCIGDNCDAFKKALLAKGRRFRPNWDGIEIRQWGDGLRQGSMAMPSRWRSRIMSRSNSAAAPNMASISLDAGESSPVKMRSYVPKRGAQKSEKLLAPESRRRPNRSHQPQYHSTKCLTINP